jgi:hypothetical protein
MTNLITTVMLAVLTIETGGEPEATRDTVVRDGGLAVGIAQIHPIAVQEANRLYGRERWTLADRTNRVESLAMLRITLAWHYRRGVRDPVDLACRWNRPGGQLNPDYRRKVEAVLGASPRCW